MFWKLLLAFTIIPAVELTLLILVGQHLGVIPTVGIIVLTGLVGAAMAKREGLAVLRQLKQDLGRGLPPASRLVEGAMVLAGGLLLITPGVLTDLAGMALIFPWSRHRMAPLATRWLLARFKIELSGSVTQVGQERREARPHEPEPSPGAGSAPFDHPIS
ncbi:MAG: FxsA family protein [Pseudomonadota bacterium]